MFRQAGVGWLKSTNLPFFRCYIFVRFRSNVGITTTHRFGYILPTPLQWARPLMTQFNLKCPSPDVSMLWLSELTMRDLMNLELSATDLRQINCSFWTKEVCTNFRGGLQQRRLRTGVERLKLVIFHLMQCHFSDILRCVADCNMYIIFFFHCHCCGWMEFSARNSCDCLFCWFVRDPPRPVHGTDDMSIKSGSLTQLINTELLTAF